MTGIEIDHDAVRRFWHDHGVGGAAEPDDVFAFGDSEAMADELLELVLHGPKRATAGSLAEFDAEGASIPEVGSHSVVCDGRGQPRAIIRTTDVRVGPLSSVDDAFAWDEGEGDRSREWWLQAHREAFGRSHAALGVPMSDEIMVSFERFTLIHPSDTVSTLYEWAGGVPAIRRMIDAFYDEIETREQFDTLFPGGVTEEHRANVTAWWAEVFGGPPTYTDELGGYDNMLDHHRNLRITAEQRAAFVSVMSEAADRADLPSDPEFRSALLAYLEWGTRLAFENSQEGATPFEGAPVPQWGWGVAPPYLP